MKKLLSVILALSIFASVLAVVPLSASAADNTGSAQAAQDVFLTGEGDIAGILTDAINDARQDEADADCENCITDVTVEGRSATVAFNNSSLCSIVVGIYDDSGEHLLMNAIRRYIEPDTGEITVEFDNDPPEFFCIRAFILDYGNCPLHKQYESERYTSAYRDFLDKTASDFPEDKVLDLDGDDTNNFAVFREEVDMLDTAGHNILRSQSGSAYLFSDVDESLSSLSRGDVFCFDNDGETEIIKVDAITVTGSTAAVIADKNISMEDVFDYVKIDTSAVSGTPEMDMSEADNGITLDDSGLAPTGSGYADLEQKEEFKFSFSFGDDDASVTGGLTIAAGYHIHLFYDRNIMDVELSVDTEVELAFTMSSEFKGKKQLGKAMIPTPIAGVAVGIGFSLVLEASAEVSSSATLSSSVGFAYNRKTGFDLISKKPNVVTELAVEGAFFIGVGISPSVMVLYGMAELALPVKVGAEITAKSALTTTDQEESGHMCHSCIDGDVSVLMTVSGGFDVLGILKKSVDFGELRYKIFDFFYSSDLGWGRGECPNHKLPNLSLFDPSELNMGDMPDSGYCTVEWDGGSTLTLRGSGTLNEEVITDAFRRYDADLRRSYGRYAQDFYDGDTHCVPESDEPLIEPAVRLNADVFYNMGKIRTINFVGFTAIDKSWAYYWLFGSRSFSYLRDIGEQLAFEYEIEQLEMVYGENYVIEGLFNVTDINISGPTVYLDSSSFSRNAGTYNNKFYYFTKLKNITFPDTIRKIGNGAFYYTAVDEVTLPESIEVLEPNAFCHLDRLTVPEGVKKLNAERSLSLDCCERLEILTDGQVTFSGCRIREVVFGSKVKRIGDRFLEGSDIESVVIPQTVEEIGYSAFASCHELRSVSLPTSLRQIGIRAFYDCTALENITIPSSVTEIDSYAFEMCTSLRKVKIPGSTTVVGRGAFLECISLNELEIEEGVKSIGPNAFYDCDLNSVTLPASLTELHYNAFYATIYLNEYTTTDGPRPKSVYYNGTLGEWKRLTVGYNYVGEPIWTDMYTYSRGFIGENYGEEYAADKRLQEQFVSYPWNFMPESYQAYTMGERPLYFTRNTVTVYCMGGKSIESISPAPVGEDIAATGVAPETYYPGSEYLIAVEDEDNGCLNGEIRYLAQTTADYDGELRYTLPEDLDTEGCFTNIYGGCAHAEKHLEDNGAGGHIYVCDICGQHIPTIFDMSKPNELQPASPTYILGDADGNGRVEVIDAAYIQRAIAGMDTPLSYEELLRGDADQNGTLELTDVTAIQYYLANLRTLFDIGCAVS